MKKYIFLAVSAALLITSCDTLSAILGIKTPEEKAKEQEKNKPVLPTELIAVHKSVVTEIEANPETISVRVKNGDASLLVWTNSNPEAAQLTAAGGNGILVPKAAGTGIIKITHPKVSSPASIVYIVQGDRTTIVDKSTADKYLTAYKTSLAGNLDEILSVRATLVNGSSLDQQNIQWATPDSTKVQIIGSTGQGIRVKPLAVGTAEITASHTASKNTLTYTILIASAGEKYIIPSRTSYLVEKDKVFPVNVGFHGNRSPAELLNISWTSADSTIAQLVGTTGASIQVIPKKVGTTTITPTHPKSSNSPAITIHVTEGTTKPDREIYLTTRRQAIELKLDASENIKVRLVGGNALDEQSIIWAVDKSDVLSLVGTTGKEIIIRGLTSGTARLTVSHPDAALPLAITVNVRDAVRTLSLSRTRINMEASDTNKPLTLTIRGGFNTDYDDVIWESSDVNVANIFGSGKNVTVNRRGVGQAVITATLTTTGQTAACNVTVLPDRYIIIPAGNIQVDRDVTTPTETEIRFHPSTLQISLTTNNTNASVVREGNKLKITGHKEGQTLLTATAGGGLGLKATLNITTYVTRTLVFPTQDIARKPKEEFNFNYTVMPPGEKDQIEFSLRDSNDNDVVLRHNSAAGTLSIKILKETDNALIITDPRKGRTKVLSVPIRSEYESSEMATLVNHGSSSYDRQESQSQHGDEWFSEEDIHVNIDSGVNVHSFEWNKTGKLHRGGYGASGIYFYPQSGNIRAGKIKWRNDEWGPFSNLLPRDCGGRSYAVLKYTITHGANATKTHTGQINLSLLCW